MIICPDCHSGKVKKNGLTHNGKQNHKCNDCGRQFILNNQHHVDDLLREIARRCLLERISLRGICRVIGVSLNWMLDFAVKTWNSIPEDLSASLSAEVLEGTQQVEVYCLQADELWSYVQKKKNKVWIWIVYDPIRKQVVAFHLGGRDERAVRQLWNKIPANYQEHCLFATDHYRAFQKVIPTKQHLIGKAHTHHIEGIFATFRARISRLVRRSQSFSKKLANHKAALAYFFWYFNLGL